MMAEVPESGEAQPASESPTAVQAAKASSRVFVSYASGDAAIASALAEALERHGVACWIAPRDVQAGALYADAIVRAISDAKALVLVLSANAVASAHVGKEVERASSKRRRLIALRIDDAPLSPALEYFLGESHWVDARADGMDAALAKLIAAIREPERTAPGIMAALAAVTSAGTASAPPPNSRRPRILLAAAIAIAVLPFVNMSGDKEQEYFSDGLTEELLNSLARIDGLQVAARTSAFAFKGKDTDIGTIARKLNVGAVLEGSVRRSAHTVRITAQLINAVTGFHLWSQTYDRDLGDVLKLQTDIANSVASALKVTLLGDAAARIEVGGTHDPAAFDAYLRGTKALNAYHDGKNVQTAIAEHSEAIRLDPNYALAFAGRSLALNGYATEFATGPVIREAFDKAQSDAQRAMELAPDLAEAHLALGRILATGSLDFARANAQYERAAALAPGDARILRAYGGFAAQMGRFDAGIASVRRAVLLDPLNRLAHQALGGALLIARRYNEAIAAYGDSLALDPDNPPGLASRGLADYALGKLQDARASCEIKPDYWASQLCLAVTYDKLGRKVDAETTLARMRASNGDDAAYQYAEIYAQWGNLPKALEWLEVALRLRDPGFGQLKTDSLLDPLRQQPRFQAIERGLKFPT